MPGTSAASWRSLKAYPTGRITLLAGAFNWGRQNVEVLYEHGFDPPPAPVVEAGKRYGRELIVKGAFDDMARATSIQTELGLMRISQAAQGKVGIPEVDAVLADYGYAGALVGLSHACKPETGSWEQRRATFSIVLV